jgi:hypothetical protein
VQRARGLQNLLLQKMERGGKEVEVELEEGGGGPAGTGLR